jgi:hypothetical protein
MSQIERKSERNKEKREAQWEERVGGEKWKLKERKKQRGETERNKQEKLKLKRESKKK